MYVKCSLLKPKTKFHVFTNLKKSPMVVKIRLGDFFKNFSLLIIYELSQKKFTFLILSKDIIEYLCIQQVTILRSVKF